MDLFKTLIVILLSSVLVNNYVLSRFLGICPFLGVSKKLDQASGMGISVTAVMLLATAATWPIQHFILNPLNLGYMQTILFILVIASLVQMLELILKRFIPALHKSLGVYLPLITTNCAVLGVALLNVQNDYNFIESVVYGITGGLGFLVGSNESILRSLGCLELQALVLCLQGCDLVLGQEVQNGAHAAVGRFNDVSGVGRHVVVGVAEAPLNGSLSFAAAVRQLGAQSIEATLGLISQIADGVIHAMEAGHQRVVEGVGAVADALLDPLHASLQVIEIELAAQVARGHRISTTAAKQSAAKASPTEQ